MGHRSKTKRCTPLPGEDTGLHPKASPSGSLRILLVEDEVCLHEPLLAVLREEGHEVALATDVVVAEERLASSRYGLVITDLRLPRGDGWSLFRKIRAHHPDTDVVLMTAYASVQQAVEAMRDSATHSLAKPFELDTLLRTVAEVAHDREVRGLSRTERDEEDWLDAMIVGEAPSIVGLKDRIRSIAPSEAAALVLGESGTGKELVARALHRASPRHESPFVAINCAAFPDTLLESELFGHERGAFTGAYRRREGRFAAARGGTLLLDEVADMSPLVQAKLLRVLEERSYQPLGTNRSVEADVRLVSATNASLRQRVGEGAFRADLYYRLRVFELEVPPLRARRSDLGRLTAHFARQDRREQAVPRLSPSAWAALAQYPFPGNVRELRHAIEHARVLSRGELIRPAHLPREMLLSITGEGMDEEPRSLQEATHDFERTYLLYALTRCEGNRTRTAQQLGISRKTLWEKMRRHGLSGAPGDGSPQSELPGSA